jgi:hypothetical protein
MLKKYWLAKTMKVNPRLAAAIQEPVRKLVCSLWKESGSTWSGEITSFRHDLIEFVASYEHCPVSVSEEERALHQKELEEYNDKITVMNELKEILGTSSEGWVSHERYAAVKEATEELKRELAMEQSNGNEELRQAWERWWPFSDK